MVNRTALFIVGFLLLMGVAAAMTDRPDAAVFTVGGLVVLALLDNRR